MLGSIRSISIVIALMIASAVPAGAADTGTISGTVFDQNGAPVADATVMISGDQLPGGRTVQTGANGLYQFEYLLPGEYTIEIDKADLGRARRAAIVEVGKDTQVDLVIGLAINEELTVTAATSDRRRPVDRSQLQLQSGHAQHPAARAHLSRPVSVDSRRRRQSKLGRPRRRRQPAGQHVSDRRREHHQPRLRVPEHRGERARHRRGQSQARGHQRRIRPHRRHRHERGQPQRVESVFGHRPDRLAVEGAGQRVQAAGRPARCRCEAGRVPRPAADDRDWTRPSGSAARSCGIASSSTVRRATLGETKWDRVNKVGDALPDEVRTGPEFYGKLTATPTTSHQLTVSYRHRPNHVDNAGLNSDFAPSVATTTDNGSRIATAEWANFMTPRSSLNVRYLYMKENNEDVPVTDLGYLPPFNPDNLSAMGQYTDPAQANLMVGGNQFTNIQNYRRHEVRGTFSQFFDVGQKQPRAEGRRRLRVRGRDVQPHRQRLGHHRQHHAERRSGAARALLHAAVAAARSGADLLALRPGRCDDRERGRR